MKTERMQNPKPNFGLTSAKLFVNEQYCVGADTRTTKTNVIKKLQLLIYSYI